MNLRTWGRKAMTLLPLVFFLLLILWIFVFPSKRSAPDATDAQVASGVEWLRQQEANSPADVEAKLKAIRQAELDARTIVSESETLQLARQKSSEIIRRAEDRSKELYHVANTYTEDALRRTEEAIQAALTEVQESRARFRAASKEQMQAQRQQLNESAAEKSEGQR